ncbi:MAG TPA: DUF5069 domain-containing protein [Verrucomicrobiae bacterium]|nr:DUF5069 domain-containing protein [Verrucomicrobiae bacterium]
MEKNIEAVKKLAKDLRREEPRSPQEELAGFTLAARCVDKCRATLAGTQGDYAYGCPMDRRFLDSAGLGVEEFKQFVATGASDEEVARWIGEHAHASTS